MNDFFFIEHSHEALMKVKHAGTYQGSECKTLLFYLMYPITKDSFDILVGQTAVIF